MTSCFDLITNCPYITKTELIVMHGLAMELPNNAEVVMLGAGPGEFMMALLEGYTHIAINATIVDNIRTNYAQAHIESDELVDIVLKGQIKYVLCDSSLYAQEYNSLLDLLIIDADHSPHGVHRDIEAWKHIVRKNGYIWFHDYQISREIINEAASILGWNLVLEFDLSRIYKC